MERRQQVNGQQHQCNRHHPLPNLHDNHHNHSPNHLNQNYHNECELAASDSTPGQERADQHHFNNTILTQNSIYASDSLHLAKSELTVLPASPAGSGAKQHAPGHRDEPRRPNGLATTSADINSAVSDAGWPSEPKTAGAKHKSLVRVNQPQQVYVNKARSETKLDWAPDLPSKGRPVAGKQLTTRVSIGTNGTQVKASRVKPSQPVKDDFMATTSAAATAVL